MNYDFLNSIGSTIGQGIGQVGNGLSSMGSTMGNAYNSANGFDMFGLGSGLRSGMADAGLGQNAIDSLMSAGKWGLGTAALGGLMGGSHGAMQGLGMGLLGGGLGSYLNSQEGSKKEHKGDIFDNGLLSSLGQSAVSPEFQSLLPSVPPPRNNTWTPLPVKERKKI